MPLVRRRFLEFMLAIGVLHAVAIAGYYLLRIPAAPPREQRIYAWTWMAFTVAVVVVGLQRIKRARRSGRR